MGQGGRQSSPIPPVTDLPRPSSADSSGKLKEAGGAGIEVVSGSHSRDECFVFARHAREHRLLASAGSDYHGPEDAWLELGCLPPLPEGCIPIWEDWALPAAAQAAAG